MEKMGKVVWVAKDKERHGAPIMDANFRNGPFKHWRRWRSLLVLAALLGAGCNLPQWVRNGFKVGPNYQRPPAPLASEWIDAKNPHVKSAPADYSTWWRVFRDPVLDDLIRTAYAQNVNLKIAGTRVLEARAQLAIAKGQLFPQLQQATGSYQHIQVSKNVANIPPLSFFERAFDDWAVGLRANWELDFWGKIRRQIESANDAVDASVDDYDNVMVTLIGDVAAAYVQYRTFEQQLVYAQENIKLQSGSLKIATDRFKAGQDNQLGVTQGTSLLQQQEALVPAYINGMRQSSNLLCTLLGMPPVDLAAKLGKASIPETPGEVVVGIPADLIRRRPDVRSAERLVAAQNAQIGVAESDFYPAFFITGGLGYEAKNLSHLFASKSFTGNIGPSFQWNILNYGRILNNVRFQDFRTQELVGAYQQKVLTAAQEVEDGISEYLNAREEIAHLVESVRAVQESVRIVNDMYTQGAIIYTAVFVAEQFLVQQQDLLAQAQGRAAQGLIQIYRAVGGGWEYRLTEEGAPEPVPPAREMPLRQASDQPIPDSKQLVQSPKQGNQGLEQIDQNPEQAVHGSKQQVQSSEQTNPSPEQPISEQKIQTPEREQRVSDIKPQGERETRKLKERKLPPADGPVLPEDPPVISSKI
jgi:NodT family efflux transporter outer membrane factor (OMF) lipoprotein